MRFKRRKHREVIKQLEKVATESNIVLNIELIERKAAIHGVQGLTDKEIGALIAHDNGDPIGTEYDQAKISAMVLELREIDPRQFDPQTMGWIVTAFAVAEDKANGVTTEAQLLRMIGAGDFPPSLRRGQHEHRVSDLIAHEKECGDKIKSAIGRKVWGRILKILQEKPATIYPGAVREEDFDPFPEIAA